MEFANYYIEEEGSSICFRADKKQRRGCPKLHGFNSTKSIIEEFPIGLCLFIKSNQKYLEVLRICQITNMTNEQNFEEYEAVKLNESNKTS